MNLPTRGCAACAILLIALLAQRVHADAAGDVQKAIDQGDAARGLQLSLAALVAKPGDARLRFLQGVALFDLKRDAQALEVFSSLAQDFPQLPEPQNNIAALHARQGQWDQARGALELALRNDPSQAAARENLGDVYLQLALQQWLAAAPKSAGNPALARKLRLGRELQSVPAEPCR